jgi:uncharacterized membrane protein YdjX (TVP38/TMEM64 family)
MPGMPTETTATTGRRAQWLRTPKLIGALLLLVATVLAMLFVPIPGPGEIRDWARATGPWFPLVFFVAHTVATVFVPRFPFTLSAGLLFGPALGGAVALSALSASAALGFLLARVLGRDAIASRLTHPAVATIDRRLARRGWLAVGSLRLITPVPFPLINYCAGLSSVRFVPYLIATAVGVLPSTITAVVFGDALTGQIQPELIVISAVFITIGLAGLVVDSRLDVGSRTRRS